MTTVFDLDGVLSRADTMAAVVFQRLRRKPWLLLPVAGLAMVAAIAGARRDVRPRCNRAIVHIVLRGVTRSEYEALAQYVARRLATRAGNVDDDVLRAVREAYARGDALVSTATEEFLASRYLQELGVGAMPLHASRFTFDATGPRFSRHNEGGLKTAAFRSAVTDGTIDLLWTDSESDLPLALISDMTVLVSPSRRALGAFSRAGIAFRTHNLK